MMTALVHTIPDALKQCHRPSADASILALSFTIFLGSPLARFRAAVITAQVVSTFDVGHSKSMTAFHMHGQQE